MMMRNLVLSGLTVVAERSWVRTQTFPFFDRLFLLLVLSWSRIMLGEVLYFEHWSLRGGPTPTISHRHEYEIFVSQSQNSVETTQIQENDRNDGGSGGGRSSSRTQTMWARLTVTSRRKLGFLYLSFCAWLFWYIKMTTVTLLTLLLWSIIYSEMLTFGDNCTKSDFS